MEKIATLDITPRTDSEYETAIDLYLSEMTRMKDQMVEEQREIEMLRAETDKILTKIMSVVDVLEAAPGHLAFPDAKAVDTYIQEERGSWDSNPVFEKS